MAPAAAPSRCHSGWGPLPGLGQKQHLPQKTRAKSISPVGLGAARSCCLRKTPAPRAEAPARLGTNRIGRQRLQPPTRRLSRHPSSPSSAPSCSGGESNPPPGAGDALPLLLPLPSPPAAAGEGGCDAAGGSPGVERGLPFRRLPGSPPLGAGDPSGGCWGLTTGGGGRVVGRWGGGRKGGRRTQLRGGAPRSVDD